MNNTRTTWTPDNARRVLAEARDAAATAVARTFADACVDSFGRNHGGFASAPGQPPNSQTGELRNSIHYVTPGDMGTPGVAHYGTNVAHGRYMHFGATVTAKRVRALPIPLNAAARRMLAKASVGSGLRQFKLKTIKSKSGEKLLVEITGTGRQKTNGAIFVLRRSVRIAARPWIDLRGRRPDALAVARALEAARRVMAQNGMTEGAR